MCELVSFLTRSDFRLLFHQGALPGPDRGGRYDYRDEEQRGERELLKQRFLRSISAYPDISMLPDKCRLYFTDHLSGLSKLAIRIHLLHYVNACDIFVVNGTNMLFLYHG